MNKSEKEGSVIKIDLYDFDITRNDSKHEFANLVFLTMMNHTP